MKNNYKRKVFIISLSVLISLITGCDSNRKAVKKEYKEFAYVELQNNSDAALEIQNQLDFLRKQLMRKNEGKQYSSTIAENIIVLSNISSDVQSLGTFGNSYELTEEILQKWEKWYLENSQYLSYQFINNKKVIVAEYPDGKRVISAN